ncbi:MAG: hypothetical protein ACOC5K_03745 [Chloroflexota bacterium]
MESKRPEQLAEGDWICNEYGEIARVTSMRLCPGCGVMNLCWMHGHAFLNWYRGEMRYILGENGAVRVFSSAAEARSWFRARSPE